MLFSISRDSGGKKSLGAFPIGPKKSLEESVMLVVLHPQVRELVQGEKLDHLWRPCVENGSLSLLIPFIDLLLCADGEQDVYYFVNTWEQTNE